MSTDMYDAYGNEQPSIGSSLRDLSISPLKPSTYIGMYTMIPKMWSIEKGIYLPFVGNTFEKGGLKAVGTGIKNFVQDAYKQKGFWGAVKGTGKVGLEFGKRVGSFGMRGGGYVGQTYMNSSTITKINPNIKSEAFNFYKNIKGYNDKQATYFSDKFLKKANYEIKKGTGSLMMTHVDKNFKSISSTINLQRTTKKLLSKNVLKIGLGLAKAGSFVGGAMFAWDLISMVGEPLGRVAVRGVDNLMMEYQNRFLPDLGGNLKLSYLTQGAATERQRAVSAISKAYINGRSALGNEAEYYHQ